MRVITLLLALALILLCSSLSLCSSSSVEEDFVYDTQGNPLQYNVNYIMVGGPFCGTVDYWPRYGGIIERDCAFDLLQHYYRRVEGTPFVFLPIDDTLSETSIRLQSPLAIYSPLGPPLFPLCPEYSPIWNVSSHTGIDFPVVTAGGIFNTPSSCFRLSKAVVNVVFNYTYFVEHCPYLCGGQDKNCYPLGHYVTGPSPGFHHVGYNASLAMNLIFDPYDPPAGAVSAI